MSVLVEPRRRGGRCVPHSERPPLDLRGEILFERCTAWALRRIVVLQAVVSDLGSTGAEFFLVRVEDMQRCNALVFQ